MRALQYTRRYSKLAGVVVGAIPLIGIPLIGWAAVDGKLQLAAPCAPITREQVTYRTPYRNQRAQDIVSCA